jgi:hypothetical protein
MTAAWGVMLRGSVRCLVTMTTVLLVITQSQHQVAALDFEYHNHSALTDYLRNVTRRFPHLAHLYTAGQSEEGTYAKILHSGTRTLLDSHRM